VSVTQPKYSSILLLFLTEAAIAMPCDTRIDHTAAKCSPKHTESS
jgi:hypothetical protein